MTNKAIVLFVAIVACMFPAPAVNAQSSNDLVVLENPSGVSMSGVLFAMSDAARRRVVEALQQGDAFAAQNWNLLAINFYQNGLRCHPMSPAELFVDVQRKGLDKLTPNVRRGMARVVDQLERQLREMAEGKREKLHLDLSPELIGQPRIPAPAFPPRGFPTVQPMPYPAPGFPPGFHGAPGALQPVRRPGRVNSGGSAASPHNYPGIPPEFGKELDATAELLKDAQKLLDQIGK
jgi:hypothetical protein